MAGHMGADRVTTRNLKVVKVDAENNLLLVEARCRARRAATSLIRKAIAAKPEAKAQVEPTQGRRSEK